MVQHRSPRAHRNFSFVGHTDLDGRGHSDQVMVVKGHAYIGHSKTRGMSVVDVRDPRNPRSSTCCRTTPIPGRCTFRRTTTFCWSRRLSISAASCRTRSTTCRPIGGTDSKRFGKRGEDFSAGMRVYDISDPANPRAIGFLEIEGLGIHRLWWTGGRYAYGSALLDGFTDHILIVIDIADPTRPEIVGRCACRRQTAATSFDARSASDLVLSATSISVRPPSRQAP